MNEGDLEPTWEASEKSDVKKSTTKRRVVARTIKSLTGREIGKVPNRAVVAREKSRTANAQDGARDIEEKLNDTLKETEKQKKRK